MDMALVAARELGRVEYKDSSISPKWNVIDDYAVSKDALFMQRSNFTIWYNDKRNNSLRRQPVEVLRKFWKEEYIMPKKHRRQHRWHRMIWTVGKAEAKKVMCKLKIVSPYIMTLLKYTIHYVCGVNYVY